MRFEFTAAVIRALEKAQELARAGRTDQVLPGHLLCALIQDDEGLPARLLAQSGLNAEQVRGLLALPLADPSQISGAELPLHPTTKRAFRLARDLGHLAAEGSLESQQVLVGLLQADSSLLDRLQAAGLDFLRLQGEVGVAPGPALPLEEPLDLGEPIDRLQAARILDAAANRAREALRVLEDYCRFVLDDAFLSGELKHLRHDLAAALEPLPVQILLDARDTPGDVGTTLTTAREGQRQALADVVQANLKRLQEALRSLEEYGKLFGPAVGAAVEALRYRSYTLERALVRGADVRARLAAARLYVLVSDAGCKHSLSGTVHEAAAGGAQIFQLREKELDDRSLLERARQMRQWTRKLGVLFIVNDRPDIALLAEADGVHLGQDDLPLTAVRRLVGPEMLIGVSTHNLGQLQRAILEGASYVGVGPTFPSATKPFVEFPGLDYVREAAGATSLPAFVLGGVNADNVDQVIAAGGRRVAVSNAVCQADDPRGAAWRLRTALQNQPDA